MTSPSSNSSIEKITAWICWYASSQETALTAVQLVKYLYLADLYHARRSGGATITGWPWAFVHFGPYCSEAIQTLEHVAAIGLVDAKRYESRYSEKEFAVYRRSGPEPEAIDSVLSFAVRGDLKKAIKRWADDTPGLLDYVYFDTEPMTGVKPHDRLDFSKAHLAVREASAKVEPPKIPERKRRKAEEAISRLKSRTMSFEAKEERLRDADYAKVLDSDVEREKAPTVSGEFDLTKLIAAALDDR
jgi:hypothetical protein